MIPIKSVSVSPRLRGEHKETLLAGLLALLALALAWQAPGPLVVDVGQPDDMYLTNFDAPEAAAGRDYRWATGDSSLHFPGLGGGPWQVTLVAAAGPRGAAPPPLTIRAGADVVLQTPAAADWRTYTFAVPARDLPAGDLDLALAIPTFRPPGENRDLALAVDSVTLDGPAPRLPAPLAWLALAGALAVLYAALRLGWDRRAAGLVTGLAALALAGLVAFARLLITPYAAYLLMLALVLFAGLYILRATLRRYAPAQVALALVLALVAGYALVSFAAQIAYLSRKPLPDDFVAFYRAAGRLLAGQPLYDAAQLARNPLDAGYKYPPFFAWLLTPLAGLSLRTALGVWNLANLGFLAAGLWALLHAHNRRLGAAAPAALGLVALALLFQPLVDTLIAGQMDLAIFGLVALTYVALRAGRPGWAGLPLAVAVLFKLYPAALLGFLLLRREWRALAGFAVATGALVAVSLPFTGLAPWADFLTVALPQNGGPTAWVENQNFAGFVARLLTDRLELEPFPPGPAWQSALLAGATGAWALLLLALAAWAAWRPAPRASAAYALGFALFTALGMMVLPNAWYHYLTLLLVPLGIALLVVEDTGPRLWTAARRPLAWALALLAGAATVLAVGSHPLVWPGVNLGGPWKLVLSYKFYATVALWAGLLVLARLAARDQGPGVRDQAPVLGATATAPEREPAPAGVEALAGAPPAPDAAPPH